MKTTERQWRVEPGQTHYQCSTTGEWYMPLSVQTQSVGRQHFVWTYCPICDRNCHTRSHPDFDPLEPQPHLYSVLPAEQGGAR